MSLTTQQIASAIRSKLLEQTSDLVTDDSLFVNINLAYDDLKIGSFTNDQIKSATIALSSGVGTLPTDFGTLYGPAYISLTDKTPLNEKSIADFDRAENGEYGITIEQGTLRVNPSTLASVLIKYYPTYAALTPTQNPEVNGYLHELIIYGALYRIHEDLQDASMRAYYEGVYNQLFAKKTGALQNYQEDNNDGGQLLNGIRII
jgi:hypothetical protein